MNASNNEHATHIKIQINNTKKYLPIKRPKFSVFLHSALFPSLIAKLSEYTPKNILKNRNIKFDGNK